MKERPSGEPARDRRWIALVTGANRGLGLETARRLATGGLRVVLGGRDKEATAAAAQGLRDRGLDAAWLELDVTDPDAIGRAAETLRRELGRLDVLVNNAGVYHEGRPDVAIARSMIDVNLFGPMRVTEALLPLLEGPDHNSAGRVVMVSSGLGELSCLGPAQAARLLDPCLDRGALIDFADDYLHAVRGGRAEEWGWSGSAYGLSKAALNAYTRILARDLQDTGLLVNAVCPGWVRTDMGGSDAERSVEEGAEGIVWAATLPDHGPSGGFFRDGQPVEW